MSGFATVRSPTTKKVAGTPSRFSASAIFGVHSGSGPSSKVSAMRLPGGSFWATSSPSSKPSTVSPSGMAGSPMSSVGVRAAPVWCSVRPSATSSAMIANRNRTSSPQCAGGLSMRRPSWRPASLRSPRRGAPNLLTVALLQVPVAVAVPAGVGACAPVARCGGRLAGRLVGRLAVGVARGRGRRRLHRAVALLGGRTGCGRRTGLGELAGGEAPPWSAAGACAASVLLEAAAPATPCFCCSEEPSLATESPLSPWPPSLSSGSVSNPPKAPRASAASHAASRRAPPAIPARTARPRRASGAAKIWSARFALRLHLPNKRPTRLWGYAWHA